MTAFIILYPMPMWMILFFLCLIRSAHGAFTTTACNPGGNICVQQSQSGSVCFYSTLTSPYSACNAPYNLPLSAHLNQAYAIGYYTATGQYLGRSNYPIQSGSTTAIYVCMSARVSSAQYYTLCARATANNGWQANGCAVGIAPPNVLDGCYVSPPRPGATWMTTTTTTKTTRISTSYPSPTLVNTTSTRFVTRTSAATLIDVSTPTPSVVTTTNYEDGITLVVTTTVGAPAASVPLATSTSPKRDVLKDSAYSVIWAPITIVLSIIGLMIHRARR